MGRISDEDIQRVREAIDLVALVSERVVLKKRGRDFWGCCPFHAEKTPSFKVDPATQLWHCFGCGAGGVAVVEHHRLRHRQHGGAGEGWRIGRCGLWLSGYVCVEPQYSSDNRHVFHSGKGGLGCVVERD